MSERRAVTLRRLVVRAPSRSEAEAAAGAFADGFARPLDSMLRWDAGPRWNVSLRASSGGADAGAAAAGALRGRIGGHGG